MRDSRSLLSLQTAIDVGFAAGFAGISANNWDDDIRRNTAEHARRWGGFNNVFDVIGHPGTHLGAAGALRLAELAGHRADNDGFSQSLLHALIITDASTVALKHIFDTTRPNGKSRGFPSGHTASSFAAAAVIDQHHGPVAGAGAYAVAGLVAWHRIDNRNHDLSDVLFGALFGSAIGNAVAKNYLFEHAGIHTRAYNDVETGTNGVLFERRY
jgi:membrane-associated phospholipid phosphatase